MGGIEHLQVETLRPVDFPEDVGEDLVVHFDGEQQLAFEVRDEATANWVVRKIAEARERAEKAKAWSEKECAAAERAEEFFLARFRGQLLAWATSQLARIGGKKRSLDLPAGRLGFRKFPSRLVVDDEKTVLAWAEKECPEAAVEIPAKTVLSREAVIGHYKRTGEIPPGCSVMDEKDEFFVK